MKHPATHTQIYLLPKTSINVGNEIKVWYLFLTKDVYQGFLYIPKQLNISRTNSNLSNCRLLSFMWVAQYCSRKNIPLHFLYITCRIIYASDMTEWLLKIWDCFYQQTNTMGLLADRNTGLDLLYAI